MPRYRYTSWDGSRRVRLDPDEVFERLSRYLSDTDNLDEALDQFLRDGFDNEAFEVMGVDELIERVREELASLYDRYNLDHALDRHVERLDDLVAEERSALERDEEPSEGDSESRAARRRLDRLPRAVDEAVGRLRGHRFRSEDAGAEFETLEEQFEDIQRLASFVREHGRMFHGKESLDFDDALELLDRIEALRQIERQLLGRDFEAIDLEAVEDLLGAEVSDAVENLRELLSAIIEAGYVRPKGGRMVLTPKGARKLGSLALREIHANLRFDSGGRHETGLRGATVVDRGETKPYRFGDPMHLDVAKSVGNAVRRGAGVPARLVPEDLSVFETVSSTRASTVLLLDMSWSMSWEGRFAAAKKVALAMDVLMRSRYPRDYFAIVGFYTRAVELDFADLPEVTWNMGDPFTNLQDGLRMGADLLSRQSGTNKSMIVITDGQPTAYHAGGRLYCEWPMSVGGLSTRATVETLKEVENVTRRGIVINTFMLDDSPPLRSFVERMTAINKGRAFYTTPDQLGRFLLVDYVAGRRKVL